MTFINSILLAFLGVTNDVLELYKYLIIIGAILSWLVAFNVINTRNRFVQVVGDFLYRITEPLQRPIRRFLPDMGGLDLSPLILFFGIIFMQRLVLIMAARLAVS